MAANSSSLAPKGKLSISATRHDALQILQSAVKVCRDAGIGVQIKNVNTEMGQVMIIGVRGVAINGTDDIVEAQP